MEIQWYPGHMTKARRMMEENLKCIDLVVEIIDARAPLSTRNPDFDDLFAKKSRAIILNKADLADGPLTAKWCDHYRAKGFFVMETVATQSGSTKKFSSLMERAMAEKLKKYREKGLQKTVRAMITGIPNVGKSTFINKLAGSARTQTGNRPGVTKGKQWVKLSDHLELMDTPGMLWPKLEGENVALHLAFLGSIRDEIMDGETLAVKLLTKLQALCPQELLSRYPKLDVEAEGEALLLGICKSRGFVLSGGRYDFERAARTVLEEFRAGKIARITLEAPHG